jgi:hypothetical protein
MKKYYMYGGEKVYFTTEEMNLIKEVGPPGVGARLLRSAHRHLLSSIRAGLTLMGFKSLRKLKVYHNFKQAYFIYPDESVSARLPDRPPTC